MCIRDRISVHIRQPLNVEAMREAIPKFIGKHDFSSFRARGCQAKTPIRSINMTGIDQEDKKIIFNDVRRFGSLHVTKNPNEHILIKNLGVEPLSKKFNKNFLFKLCSETNLEIKKLLMDQRKVVGVGNIYASESLYLSSISPLRKSKEINLDECEKLVKSIKKILKYAIKMGGTTLKDFYSADGSEGYFKLKLNVPLPDLLKGPRAKIVFADATTPVPTKFSLSLFAV